jgi:hypothetical protein
VHNESPQLLHVCKVSKRSSSQRELLISRRKQVGEILVRKQPSVPCFASVTKAGAGIFIRCGQECCGARQHTANQAAAQPTVQSADATSIKMQICLRTRTLCVAHSSSNSRTCEQNERADVTTVCRPGQQRQHEPHGPHGSPHRDMQGLDVVAWMTLSIVG